MDLEKLDIEGAWHAKSEIHEDNRGSFREWFRKDLILQKTGIEFSAAQANISHSSKGALRGIHYSLIPNGQAKWITCVSGKVFDVIIDIRPESQTFMEWISIELSPELGNSLLLSGQLGHAFMALEDNTSITYMLDSTYSVDFEHTINPFDSDIGIKWPLSHTIISSRDQNAPSIFENMKQGLLPIMQKNIL